MFQYSLRTLLIVMLVASIAVWAIFVLPSPWSMVVFDGLLTVGTGMIVAGIVYFRGYRQAFCIGAAPAEFLHFSSSLGPIWPTPIWSLISPGSIPTDEEGWNLKIGFASAIAFMFLAGAAGMLIRFLAVRAKVQQKDEQIISPAQSHD